MLGRTHKWIHTQEKSTCDKDSVQISGEHGRAGWSRLESTGNLLGKIYTYRSLTHTTHHISNL